MKKNIGTFDRIMRALGGVICILLAIFIATGLVGKIILIVAGIFCFFQAITSWCLLYQLMGKTTCPVE